jgi:hypothetical protein
MHSPPIISDKQPDESPESGEGAGHPRPERPGCAGPLDAEATGQIVAERIGVAGVRHVPFPFAVGGCDKQIANCSECSCAQTASPALRRAPVIADLEFANAKLVEMGMAGLLIGGSDRDVRQIGRCHWPRPRLRIQAGAAAMAMSLRHRLTERQPLCALPLRRLGRGRAQSGAEAAPRSGQDPPCERGG